MHPKIPVDIDKIYEQGGIDVGRIQQQLKQCANNTQSKGGEQDDKSM